VLFGLSGRSHSVVPPDSRALLRQDGAPLTPGALLPYLFHPGAGYAVFLSACGTDLAGAEETLLSLGVDSSLACREVQVSSTPVSCVERVWKLPSCGVAELVPFAL
jgi:hypothetical protein